MPITILLAEDNQGDVYLIRRALEQHAIDAELIVFEDGKSALRYIEQVDADESAPMPNIALLDLNLPRVSGLHVLARIRLSPRAGAIPIVIVTSSDSPLDRDSAARLGATGYFQKPGGLDAFMQLGQIVRSALDIGVAGAPNLAWRFIPGHLHADCLKCAARCIGRQASTPDCPPPFRCIPIASV